MRSKKATMLLMLSFFIVFFMSCGDSQIDVPQSPINNGIGKPTATTTITTAQTPTPIINKTTSTSTTAPVVTSSTTNSTTSAALSKGIKVTSAGTIDCHYNIVHSLAFSPDGKTLACAPGDNTIRLYSEDGKLLNTLQGHTSDTTAVAWSPDGKILATGSQDKTVRLWGADGKTGNTLITLPQAVFQLAWSPTGNRIAVAGLFQVQLIDVITGARIATLSTNNKVAGYTFVAWSPDGQTLAVADDTKDVEIWSSNGRLMTSFKGHTNYVAYLAWSPDGKILASSSQDNTIRLWDASGKLLTTMVAKTTGLEALAWSPNGKYLAKSGGTDKKIYLWDSTGKELSVFSTDGKLNQVSCVIWSPDSKNILAGSTDSKDLVQIWKVEEAS